MTFQFPDLHEILEKRVTHVSFQDYLNCTLVDLLQIEFSHSWLFPKNMKKFKNIKCVLVGESKSGKTALLYTLSKGIFPNQYLPTVINNVNVKWTFDGYQTTICLWDTPGHEDLYSLRNSIYQNADVVIIAFRLHKSSKLHHVRDKWHAEVRKHCPRVPIILVGTNMDIREHLSHDNNLIDDLHTNRRHTKDEVVDYKSGLAMAKEIGAIKYLESSARLRVGFEDLYNEICKAVIYRGKRLVTFRVSPFQLTNQS